MTKRVWLTSIGTDFEVTKTEPTSIGLNVAVKVRAAEGTIPFDGVWLNGVRSFDTYIIVDGDVKYHSPAESTSSGEAFELHEAAGGGDLL
jgi:hypothetical protein